MNDKAPKMINRLHLIYTIIISIGIVLAVIICQKNAICETAFANFSFAATITSIVLAVVSIVYSILSGINSNNQMSGMREIEGRISKELSSFRSLEDTIRRSVREFTKPIEDEVKGLHEDQVGMRQSLTALMNLKTPIDDSNKGKQKDKFNYNMNSKWGNVLLYACSLSHNKNRILPKDILEKYSSDFSHYFFGYMISLSATMPNYYAHSDGSCPVNSQIITFDESYFGTTNDIKKVIDSYRSEEFLGQAISDIEKYFGVC